MLRIKNIAILFVVIILTLAGCSSGVSQEDYDALQAENEALRQELASLTGNPVVQNEPSDYELKSETVDAINFETSVGQVSYSGHEFTPGDLGTDIIIYFTFTNNSDEYMCLYDAAHFQAYQDGMQIDLSYIYTEEADNAWREIANGKTLDCAIAFEVSGTTDVQLRVSPVVDGCFDSSVYQEQILSQ